MFNKKVPVFNYANNETINRAIRDINRTNNNNTQKIINTIVGCTLGMVALGSTHLLYEKCRKNKELKQINDSLNIMSDNIDDNTSVVDALNDMITRKKEKNDDYYEDYGVSVNSSESDQKETIKTPSLQKDENSTK
jgi:hypothetical protein